MGLGAIEHDGRGGNEPSWVPAVEPGCIPAEIRVLEIGRAQYIMLPSPSTNVMF